MFGAAWSTLIVNEPLLISSTSSPASTPKVSALQTVDKAKRGLSFPTKDVSAGADVVEEEACDAEDPSNNSDNTCMKRETMLYDLSKIVSDKPYGNRANANGCCSFSGSRVWPTP